MKPENVDPDAETVADIRLEADKDPNEKQAANHWKNMAWRFVIAATPDYLKPIVSDSEFEKFLQKPQNVSVAQSLLTQLLSESQKNV